MKNIIDICKDFGFEVPADKHADFLKAVAAEYKTNAEHGKVADKLAAATKRAETAEEALKGFEGIDPAKVTEQLAEANRKVKEAQEEAQRQIAERDTNDAIAALLSEVEFTSPAARRDVERQLREKGLKLDNGALLGGTDALAAIQKAEPESFVTNAEANKARFTDPKSQTKQSEVLTPKEISHIKDHVERRKAWETYITNKGE